MVNINEEYEEYKEYEGCKGCNNGNSGCLIRYHKPFARECMCRTCLIKVVCKTQCKDRQMLFRSLSHADKVWLRKQFRIIELCKNK